MPVVPKHYKLVADLKCLMLYVYIYIYTCICIYTYIKEPVIDKLALTLMHLWAPHLHKPLLSSRIFSTCRNCNVKQEDVKHVSSRLRPIAKVRLVPERVLSSQAR